MKARKKATETRMGTETPATPGSDDGSDDGPSGRRRHSSMRRILT